MDYCSCSWIKETANTDPPQQQQHLHMPSTTPTNYHLCAVYRKPLFALAVSCCYERTEAAGGNIITCRYCRFFWWPDGVHTKWLVTSRWLISVPKAMRCNTGGTWIESRYVYLQNPIWKTYSVIILAKWVVMWIQSGCRGLVQLEKLPGSVLFQQNWPFFSFCKKALPQWDTCTVALTAAAAAQRQTWVTILQDSSTSPLHRNCVHKYSISPLNAELNPICYLLALLGAHHFLHVSRIRVNDLTLILLTWRKWWAPNNASK